MIGVCMTVLTISHLGSGGPWRILIDKLLAIDALVFWRVLYYHFSMRSINAASFYESRAELVFLYGGLAY